MADGNSTAGVPESVAPFGLPRIAIPPEHQIDEVGRVRFQIETTAGRVSVRAFLRGFDCDGTAKALQAAGLARKEWMPGEPGNNAVRQTVVFDSDGPHLKLGRWKLTRRDSRAARITIDRLSRGKYRVEVPGTPEQVEFLGALHERRTKERREAEERAEMERVRKATEPQSAGEFRARKLKIFDALTSVIEVRARSRGRYGYTSEAEGRIIAAAAELRRAIAEGAIIERPECRRVGNVLYLNAP